MEQGTAPAPAIPPQAWAGRAVDGRAFCSHQASSGPELLLGDSLERREQCPRVFPTTAAALVLQQGMLMVRISHQLPPQNPQKG